MLDAFFNFVTAVAWCWICLQKHLRGKCFAGVSFDIFDLRCKIYLHFSLCENLVLC